MMDWLYNQLSYCSGDSCTSVATLPPPIFIAGFAKCTCMRSFCRMMISKSHHHFYSLTIAGGTTALWSYLTQHPDVIPPQSIDIRTGAVANKKELLFWNSNKFLSKQGLASYESLIHGSTLASGANTRKHAIDGSPMYILNATTAERIMKSYPHDDASFYIIFLLLTLTPTQVKIILVVRDPIVRMYSHYRISNITQSFDEFVEKELSMVSKCAAGDLICMGRSFFLKHGCYDLYINAYREKMPERSLCVISNVCVDASFGLV